MLERPRIRFLKAPDQARYESRKQDLKSFCLLVFSHSETAVVAIGLFRLNPHSLFPPLRPLRPLREAHLNKLVVPFRRMANADVVRYRFRWAAKPGMY